MFNAWKGYHMVGLPGEGARNLRWQSSKGMGEKADGPGPQLKGMDS